MTEQQKTLEKNKNLEAELKIIKKDRDFEKKVLKSITEENYVYCQ